MSYDPNVFTYSSKQIDDEFKIISEHIQDKLQQMYKVCTPVGCDMKIMPAGKRTVVTSAPPAGVNSLFLAG